MTTSSGTQTKAGIAYFIITPSLTPSLGGSVVKQGVLALADNNLSYGAVGVSASGRGVIAFTLLGAGGSTNPGNFPSSAYASVDALVGAGSMQTAAAGRWTAAAGMRSAATATGPPAAQHRRTTACDGCT